VPPLLASHGDQLPLVAELGDDVLGVPEEVDPAVLLGRDRRGGFSAPEPVLELVVVTRSPLKLIGTGD
jgi:hypothetical protein